MLFRLTSFFSVAAMSLLSPFASFAAPITYTINFTTTSGIAPTSGSFTYDSALPTNAFTNFLAVWNTRQFDFTSAANSYTPAVAACGGQSGSLGAFDILDGVATCGTTRAWRVSQNSFLAAFAFLNQGSFQQGFFAAGAPAGTETGFVGQGTFTITPQATSTPEPSTVSATLLAIGLGMLAARKG